MTANQCNVDDVSFRGSQTPKRPSHYFLLFDILYRHIRLYIYDSSAQFNYGNIFMFDSTLSISATFLLLHSFYLYRAINCFHFNICKPATDWIRERKRQRERESAESRNVVGVSIYLYLSQFPGSLISAIRNSCSRIYDGIEGQCECDNWNGQNWIIRNTRTNHVCSE